MRQTLKNILDQNKILVIDGSMGTAWKTWERI